MEHTILTRKQFYDICSTLQDTTHFDSILTDYSGRSMYGKSCLAIVGDMEAVFGLTHALAETIIAPSRPEEHEDVALEMIKLGGSVRTDNMGLDTVFYWPSISVEEES